MTIQPALPQHLGVIPDVPIMRRQTYSSPMSYVGITRRTTAWVRRVSANPLSALLAWVAAACFLSFMYAFLVAWYFVTLVMFGVLLFPFRLIRRSHRRQEHLQRQQLATMQALLVQQQIALQANRGPTGL